MQVPAHNGIHCIKLPVSDLDRRAASYGAVLGYLEIEPEPGLQDA